MQQMKQVHKTLLRNVIRHTELHNRIVEEEECWRQHEARQMSKSVKRESDESASKQKTVRPKSLPAEESDDEDPVHPHKKFRAHMDDVGEVQRQVYSDRDGERRVGSNFWLRQLDAAESSDPNRWGHSGYKELYPKDFKEPCDSNEVDSGSSSGSQLDTRPSSAKRSKHKKKSKDLKKHRKKSKLKKHKVEKESLDVSPPTGHRTDKSKRKHRGNGSKKKKKRHRDH